MKFPFTRAAGITAASAIAIASAIASVAVPAGAAPLMRGQSAEIPAGFKLAQSRGDDGVMFRRKPTPPPADTEEQPPQEEATPAQPPAEEQPPQEEAAPAPPKPPARQEARPRDGEDAERPRRRQVEEEAPQRRRPEQEILQTRPSIPSEERPQRVERPRDRDNAERRQRDDRRRIEEQPRQAGGELLQMLRDRRPAGELTDAELRQRIEVYGRALDSNRLDGGVTKRVRAQLQAYNTELSRRISAATGVDAGGIDANREARRLLDDGRAPARLGDDDLRQRISRTRTVLSLPGLNPRFEESLRQALTGDREELRSRVASVERPQGVRRDRGQADRRTLRRQMLEARDERRRRLDDPSYRIVIPQRQVRRRAPMATIPLAEAYDEQLQEQLMAPPAYPIDRRYTIEEYRANPSLRTLMPGIEVDTVKFGFNEDFLREEEILKLDRVGEIMERIIAGDPQEVFLIEGHTDLVGSAAYNEDLSWRRAEAVREALTQFFYIPRENLEIIGYGEQFPRIPTEFEEPENRRSTIRRITPLLYGQR